MTLWLCARVPALRQAVAVEARRALSEVAVSQNADGSWHEMNVRRGPRYENYERVLPSPFVTALAVNTMQAFVPAQFQDQQARAIGWLCQVQLQDGSWADREVDSKGDLWATLAALGSLKGGQSGDLGRYIDAGEAWLLSHQNSLGVYHGVPFTDPFACVLVLEYFARERRAHQPSDRFTQAAIQLIGRANDIVAHDYTDFADRALAIFAIHHAVEFFLYGVLQLPSVDINIYANEKETLGLRQALASLRDHLRAIDKLKPAQELSFRTQISDLANDRDSSVHKARDIQQDQLRTHLETAKKFVSKYSHMTMGRDILRE
jgi:hypothetical protein